MSSRSHNRLRLKLQRFCQRSSEPIYTLEQAFGSPDHESPPPSHTTQLQFAPAAVIPEVTCDMRTCDYVQCLIAQEVSRKYENRAHQALQKTVKHAL